MDAANAFARFAVNLKYEDIPSDAVEATKRDILDTLGTAIAGSATEGTKEVVELVRELGGKKTSTIFAYGGKVSAPEAALANGLMAHALRYDDTHDVGAIHAGCSVVPASFAVAEQVGMVSGKEFITAIAVGLDIACRMALATKLGPVQSGWHYTSTYGYFAAAAAASRILKLDVEQTSNALGIAYSQAAGNMQASHEGAATKSLQPGFAARGGVMSALMAQKGVTGAKNSLEGRDGLYRVYLRGEYDASTLTDELGKRFEVTNLSFKPYPGCRLNHTAIDAALALAREDGTEVKEIKEVTVLVGANTFQLCCEPLEDKRRPRTPLDCDYSLPYSVAVALARKGVTIEDFSSQDAIRDSLVLDIARKVTPRMVPELTVGKTEPAVVELRTTDNRIRTKRIDFPTGDPRNPIDIDAKFRDCAHHSIKALSEKKLEKVIELVKRLEELDDVGLVVRSLG